MTLRECLTERAWIVYLCGGQVTVGFKVRYFRVIDTWGPISLTQTCPVKIVSEISESQCNWSHTRWMLAGLDLFYDRSELNST
jgi:hypothetical protein